MEVLTWSCFLPRGVLVVGVHSTQRRKISEPAHPKFRKKKQSNLLVLCSMTIHTITILGLL